MAGGKFGLCQSLMTKGGDFRIQDLNGRVQAAEVFVAAMFRSKFTFHSR